MAYIMVLHHMEFYTDFRIMMQKTNYTWEDVNDIIFYFLMSVTVTLINKDYEN
jgi:hypothetical protein